MKIKIRDLEIEAEPIAFQFNMFTQYTYYTDELKIWISTKNDYTFLSFEEKEKDYIISKETANRIVEHFKLFPEEE